MVTIFTSSTYEMSKRSKDLSKRKTKGFVSLFQVEFWLWKEETGILNKKVNLNKCKSTLNTDLLSSNTIVYKNSHGFQLNNVSVKSPPQTETSGLI